MNTKYGGKNLAIHKARELGIDRSVRIIAGVLKLTFGPSGEDK